MALLPDHEMLHPDKGNLDGKLRKLGSETVVNLKTVHFDCFGCEYYCTMTVFVEEGYEDEINSAGYCPADGHPCGWVKKVEK